MVTFRIDNEVTLREFTPDDAEDLFETVRRNYDHLSSFMHWITPDYDLGSARRFIAKHMQDRQDRASLNLGIFRRETCIGSIGFTSFDWAAMKTEIGYWIASDEQGKGIVSGACEKLIDFAFADLGMNRIQIRCSADNVRSSAIPRRFGFKREGLLRQAEMRNGRLHDFEIYGMLASEWAGRQQL